MDNNASEYTNFVTAKIILFAIISIVAIPYYFIAGGTILAFIITRIIAKIIQTIGTIGYHRWLCHNSFKPTTTGKYLMLFGMITNGIGRPLHVVIAHRLHHGHTDTEYDPHSPKYMSWWNMWLGKYTVRSGFPIPRDFFRHKEVIFVNKNYWKLFWLFNIILAIIDLKTALIFCPLTFTYSWLGSTIINYFAHKESGKNNYSPQNLPFYFMPIAFGEELHKNHHDHPSSYSFDGNGRTDYGKLLIEKLLISKPKPAI